MSSKFHVPRSRSVVQVHFQGYNVRMIAWAQEFMRRKKRVIRLRQPQSTTLITGSDREAIDAVYDAGQRLVHLVIYTRQRSLQRTR